MTYNKDLQEDKEALFDAVRTVENCVRMIRKVVENMRVNPERMMDAAKKGYLNATELADYLVSKQMPFREAHTLVGKIVVRAAELGITLEEMPLRNTRFLSLMRAVRVSDLSRAISRRSEREDRADRSPSVDSIAAQTDPHRRRQALTRRN